jgi:hypothetical protein
MAVRLRFAAVALLSLAVVSVAAQSLQQSHGAAGDSNGTADATAAPPRDAGSGSQHASGDALLGRSVRYEVGHSVNFRQQSKTSAVTADVVANLRREALLGKKGGQTRH